MRQWRSWAVLALVVAAGCSSTSSNDTDSAASSSESNSTGGVFEVAGLITGGTPCSYSSDPDIRTGQPVTILDPTGAQIATGRLEDGSTVFRDSSEVCRFPFTVPNVPSDLSTYTVQFGDADLALSESELAGDLKIDTSNNQLYYPGGDPDPGSPSSEELPGE